MVHSSPQAPRGMGLTVHCNGVVVNIGTVMGWESYVIDRGEDCIVQAFHVPLTTRITNPNRRAILIHLRRERTHTKITPINADEKTPI